jgi:hypothetical protein
VQAEKHPSAALRSLPLAGFDHLCHIWSSIAIRAAPHIPEIK